MRMHTYAMAVYDVTSSFPKDERYGITSQIRRASLSVILNFVEGYARFTKGDKRRFFQIAYGSLQESKYLLYFCKERKFISINEYKMLLHQANEIGKMLYRMMKPLIR